MGYTQDSTLSVANLTVYDVRLSGVSAIPFEIQTEEPRSCQDIYNSGQSETGFYTIFNTDGSEQSVQCVMDTTLDAGWTLVTLDLIYLIYLLIYLLHFFLNLKFYFIFIYCDF